MSLRCAIPSTAVLDTVSISVSLVGDILGASLNNLDSLIQIPYGCGEQNMLNFVPDIVILRYLELSNKLTNETRSKAISFIELGYQRELEFLRNDGSFSAFGNSDTTGSTWLTAFVVKSFLLAEPYTTIDMTVVQMSLSFIISKQNADGSFREDGRVIHTDMQGGSSSGISLTAYLAIVLSECLQRFPQYEAQRDNALSYLTQNYNTSEVYSMGILSYALSLADDSNYTTVFNQFYSLAIETSDDLHWEKVNVPEQVNFWDYRPKSLDVEITSYGLLAVFDRDFSMALRIIRWIVKQQNSQGGFQSTQDTVMALDALSKAAAQMSSSNSNIALTLISDESDTFSTFITSDNALVLQTFTLSQTARELDILVDDDSHGVAVISLSCNYYEVIDDQAPRFKIDHRLEDPCYGYLMNSICLSYIPISDDVTSNMVLMRMQLPSGFIYDINDAVDPKISVSSNFYKLVNDMIISLIKIENRNK